MRLWLTMVVLGSQGQYHKHIWGGKCYIIRTKLSMQRRKEYTWIYGMYWHVALLYIYRQNRSPYMLKNCKIKLGPLLPSCSMLLKKKKFINFQREDRQLKFKSENKSQVVMWKISFAELNSEDLENNIYLNERVLLTFKKFNSYKQKCYRTHRK